MGFATNHKAQRAVVDFLKISEKRLAEVNKNTNERTVSSANTKNTHKATQSGMSDFNGE